MNQAPTEDISNPYKESFTRYKGLTPSLLTPSQRSRKLLALEGSQSFLGIGYFSNARVSVFPELEEFFVMLDGFADHFLLREIHPAQQVLEARV